MWKLLTTKLTKTLVIIVLGTLTHTSHAEGFMKKKVSFDSNNDTIVGNLFLPENYDPRQKLPAVIITGAWTTVKEQMPTNYAKEMTARGFTTLVFDFRGWGESSGTIKYYEDPHSKTQDIISAANFLLTQNVIDNK